MSYLANFQHPEAGFQFMTILPLIQKQRWRKMFEQRIAWDCLQQNYRAWECQAKPHPSNMTNLPRQGRLPFYTFLWHVPTPTQRQSPAPDATCSSHHPTPLHTVACVEMSALLYLLMPFFLLDPARRPPWDVASFHRLPLAHIPAPATRLRWSPGGSVGQLETPTVRPRSVHLWTDGSQHSPGQAVGS